MLEYLGEFNLFYALYDNPAQVQRLLKLLDEQMLAILDKLADFPWVYVEFPDNLHSLMTNPKLFDTVLPAGISSVIPRSCTGRAKSSAATSTVKRNPCWV